ncbi:GntR family transcriptional regulator [Ornithinimicrobium tianjinense]|uniref:GntR family transcriptional regulator n=1 Tax=Ornithinimicrobium tianjinense TaxID=1195761 RepID=A0A917BGJ4_9MICO|nr:GntR family transcriptional regulator [Ornithinimicrobium tianjinense]GGF43930.1 GntR family transcriptional regulator [Ornithinimicrobium tianjinense]
MFSPVDASSSTPPFEQLRAQVLTLVGDGALVPGDRLPTVRSLAGELGMAPNTVARAYRELEADGVLEGRGRSGTFVRAGVVQGRTADALVSARAAAERYAEATTSLGMEPEAALALVRRALGL